MKYDPLVPPVIVVVVEATVVNLTWSLVPEIKEHCVVPEPNP
jgi:hypothetical protein